MTHTAWPNARRSRTREQTVELLARSVIFLYIDLWILEGALRKWIPGLSEVAYVARDGIAFVAVVVLALMPYGHRRSGIWFWLPISILLCLGSVQVFANDISLPMLAIGVRAFAALALLPLLVWQYPRCISLEQISWRLMIHLPLQATIIVLQVVSPPAARINWIVGEESAGFVNFGVVRSTGTFTAVSGLGAYLGVVAAVALVGMLSDNRRFAHLSVLSATLTFFCALLGGDRSTLLTVASTTVAFAIFIVLSPLPTEMRVAARRLVWFLGLASATFILAVTEFSAVIASFTERFESAAQSENSGERILRQTLEFSGLISSDSTPRLSILGDGLASHTQAGIALGSSNAWIEIEASRWIAEMGILGYVLAWLRIVVAIVLIGKSVASIRAGDPSTATFSFLLISVMLPGLITQTPSTQGAFGVMVVLMLLSLQRKGAATRSPGQTEAWDGAPRSERQRAC